MPRIGLTISALPPSAAIVRAARQIDLASSGNVSKSFKAGLDPGNGSRPWDHRLVPVRRSREAMLSYMTTSVNQLTILKSRVGELHSTQLEAPHGADSVSGRDKLQSLLKAGKNS
jgi:hypothetical protein